MTFKDIYPKINERLVEQDFYLKDTKEKKQLVDNELKNYMLEKIDQLGIPGVLTSKHKDDVSVCELAEVLATLIPINEHFETIRHLTHFVTQIASTIQGHSVVWWSCEDGELGNPEVTFYKDGKWDEINTHPQESYSKIFETAYNTFQNNFMKEYQECIQYTLVRPKKEETE